MSVSLFSSLEECQGDDVISPKANEKDIYVQLVISMTLGVSSFIAFCLLRPRWKSLYAARKQHSDAAMALPNLPDTFFGWIPVLYRVTEEQVLASAGLDAFVFLSFFKMSIKFLGVAFVLAALVIAPINKHFVGLDLTGGHRKDNETTADALSSHYESQGFVYIYAAGKGKHKLEEDESYLWAYLVFTYVFTGLAIYFLTAETRKIIKVRQDYLGSQSTITDKTIRISGIPEELRSEEKIIEILEKLKIGKVENVTLCRNWKFLDDLMEERTVTLRKLEEAVSVHLGRQQAQRNFENPSETPTEYHDELDQDENGDRGEADNLLDNASNEVSLYGQPRPTTRIRSGFWNLSTKKVDAIDYYEERLRRVDEKIKDARKKEYTATPLAFVTMDSIPAAQMAVQALIDPAPLQFQASLAPAPSDIVWPNTYLSRSSRMLRSWSITIFILILTVIWLIPVASLASLLNLCAIEEFAPDLAAVLSRHDVIRALVQTGLPTLVVSLLNVAVPFLYDFLANYQGSISQSDVELSVISKNFLFTFFNFFLVFTVFGTASKIWPVLQDSLKDATKIAYNLATSLQTLGLFYTNFIMLQGIGLFPMRLLEFGSVSLYPIMRWGAKTPRDFAELEQPPVFKYGFYLPTSLLVFILCVVYSILPAGFLVLLFGLIYFVLGYFTYKYQLLYAMDHPQHATGAAWTMISYRIILGLGIFQLAMAGVIALKQAFTAALLVLPLIMFTMWFSYFYARTFEPLTKYIALRSIRRDDDQEVNLADEYLGIHRPPGRIRRRSTIDEDRERGQKFVNPSLIVPLEKMWIHQRPSAGEETPTLEHEESTASSFYHTHIAAELASGEADRATTSHIHLSRGVAKSTPLTNCHLPSAAAPLYPVISDSNSDSIDTMVVGRRDPSATLLTSNMQPSVEDDVGVDIDDTDNSHTQHASQMNVAANIRSRPDKLHQQTSSLNTDLKHLGSDGNLSNTLPGSGTLPHPKGKYNAEPKDPRPQRGRALRRARRVSNPFSRAESRNRANDASIEVNVRFMKSSPTRRNAFYKGRSSSLGELEDIVLEPLAPGRMCASVNEILESSRPPVPATRKPSVRSTSDQGNIRKKKIPWAIRSRKSAATSDSNLSSKAETASATGVEQSTRSGRTVYSDVISLPSSPRMRTPGHIEPKGPVEKPSTASVLPPEILSKVYQWLSPSDFNSARLSCRSWYINSLEYSLLDAMLKRSGWYASIQRELFNNKSVDRHLRMSDEWLMSKHLAKECALGPDWRGNGIPSLSTEQSPTHAKGWANKTPFRLISKLDFTNMGTHYPGSSSEACGLLFTVSACTKFLMVARGCIVFVYELNRSHRTGKGVESGAIRPITSIICPRRVLGCSMDTSSNRDAIAILMDGRMGLVCAITGNTNRPGPTMTRDLRKMQEQSDVFPVSRGGSWRQNISLGTSHSLRSYPEVSNQHFRVSVLAPGQPLADRSSGPELGERYLGRDYYTSAAQRRVTSEPLTTSSYPMPTEASPPTLYTLICSPDDPPRSIAICPQRRCVAFGCSSGIELHWIDALTGEDLNRWFPLTAPSDHLYFLPPRTGVDSAKKLRLVSSQGTPGERAPVGERFSGRKRSSAFWAQDEWDASDMFVNTDIESESRRRITNGGDHYRAIPLSDGYHLLFIDPTSGVLCLGSDAPFGGPTKLLRKLWFSGPVGEGSPVAYAAACDLRWGVRVVAAYGLGREQTIWLFSVPIDVFTDGHGRGEQPHIINSVSTISRETARGNADWMPWWGNDGNRFLEWPSFGYGSRTNMMWPLQVRGQQVGQCAGLVDLAIHTGSGVGVTIWAFTRQAVALTWKLDSGTPHQDHTQRLVVHDGTVREIDGDGDIEMCNSPVSRSGSHFDPTPSQQEQFDGTASRLFPEVTRSSRRRRNSWSLEQDAEGDVLMDSLRNPKSRVIRVDREEDCLKRRARFESGHSFEAVAMANDGDGLHYGHRRDLVEQLTGAARIDIEIR
ncbi:hypothetical protein V500_01127 [Pseudogymnoascus sp. VKM F-4518 (FW-2643)]|nr:hypothetical protein V500_01127 [Pseudogymnoascus sp. VKM F-4518 (FW-2643)]